MRFDGRDPGLIASAGAHGVLLAAAVLGLWSPARYTEVAEAVPVEIIAESQMPKGAPEAPRAEPKPPALRQAVVEARKPEVPLAPKELEAPSPPPAPPPPPPPPRPVEAEPKPAEPPPPAIPAPPSRPPARAAVDQPPRPVEPKPEPPEAEIVEPKPVKKLEPLKKAEPPKREPPKPVKKVEPQKPEPPRKPDRIAEIITAKPEPPVPPAAKARPQAPPAPPAPPREPPAESGFNPADITTLLRSKEKPTTTGATGPVVSRQAALGLPTASAPKMTASEQAALVGIVRDHLMRCWSVPPGLAGAAKPVLRFTVTREGVAGAPTVTNTRGDANFRAVADSAMRAVRSCARLPIPSRFLPFHGDWSTMVITFDPTDAL